MGFAFNPFTGTFDVKGAGGGGASYIDGEVATYADLPLQSNLIVSGLSQTNVNGTYLYNGQVNGRPSYELRPYFTIFWDSQWQIDANGDVAYSLSDVANPWLATGWLNGGGLDPTGLVITESNPAPTNSAWLVRTASGVWPVSRKQAGIYIRTATAGSNRDADYTYAGTMPDVFSDAVLTIYDEASTTRTGQFNLGNITAGQNRVLTWPDAAGTIALTGQLTDTQIFTANDTWTKPAGAKLVHYFIVAGGGGGGSGRRDTTANNGGGGGGGAGGSVSVGWVDASALAGTVTVTIGSGGGGGQGNRPNGTSGSAGTAGGASSFGSISSTGGQAGAAGTGAIGGAGAGASSGLGLYYAASLGRGPSGTGGFTAAATAPAASVGTAAGGGGGGGKQATTYYNGANGGAIGLSIATTAGGTFVANAAGNNGALWIGGYLGTGGGGGSTGTGGQANNGGNGGLYGGGGGGGSACDNDAGGEGKGGDGANGIVIITTYF